MSSSTSLSSPTEFLSLALGVGGDPALRVQTNDADPRSLVRLFRRSGFEADGPGGSPGKDAVWRGLGGGGERTAFAVRVADQQE